MSVIVRVAGPEFTDERSREAFLRIEESIRQFGTHTRESFSMVRGPLPLSFDHFVLLWSRGSALVALLPYGGRIRGGKSERWTTEQRFEHSVSETSFENPYQALSRQREVILQLLNSSAQPMPAAGDHFEDDREPFAPALVAIFTGDLADVRPHDIPDKSFNAVSIDYALSRTMFHMPNLLRLSDRGSSVYSAKELEAQTDRLESAAAIEELNTEERRGKQLQSFRRAREKRKRARVSFTWVAAAVVAGIVLYVLLKPTPDVSTQSNDDTTATVVQHRSRSSMVIRLPVETQLFVSPQVFTSRSELDSALSHGAGLRFLPDTLHIVRLDSLGFAKGVYGYFKVDDAWRKGKLLQTFKPRDTIVVDNFLDPLK